MIGVSKGGRDDRLGETLITERDSVQELQRKLYRKAKSEPKFRFYSLYDKIYREDVLKRAWEKVKQNRGSSGIDRQTIEDVEKGGEDILLEGIRDELRSGEYEPTAVRRVYIPKGDGGKRPLGIPTVKDRVIQMAVKIVIEPVFEAGFEDNSYGYRPKRSAQQAVQEIKKYLKEGNKEVIEGDLKDCFGSIPHRELLEMIAARIVDKRIMRLINQFLKAGVMEEREVQRSDKGTPQGGVISPLLANIYLDKLDKGWKPYSKISRLIRYADDFVIITRYKAKELLERLTTLTGELKLTLNKEKTKVVNSEEEVFDFLGFSYKKGKNRRGKITAYNWPSHKAENKINERIREITDRRRKVKVDRIITELNDVMRGWVNYFKIGNSSKKFGKVRLYLENRVRKFMRQRRQKGGYGYREYPNGYLYKELGLYHNYRLSWTKAL